MRNFYTEFHTKETLRRQIADIYAMYPSAYLVGSLGRATVYRALEGNPYLEFTERRQNPLKNGKVARDVDFIGVEHDFAAYTLPFWIDATSYNNSDARLVEDGDDWFLTTDSGFCEPVNAAIMEPVPAETIYGIPCITTPAETQLALLKARGAFRPKDVLAFKMLARTLEAHPNRERRLPPAFFEVFSRLHIYNGAELATTP